MSSNPPKIPKKRFSAIPFSSRKVIGKGFFLKNILPGVFGNRFKKSVTPLSRQEVRDAFGEKLGYLDPKVAGKKSENAKFLTKKESKDLLKEAREHGMKEEGKFRNKTEEEIFQQSKEQEYYDELVANTPVDTGPTNEELRLEKARKRWRSRESDTAPTISKLEGKQESARQEIMAHIGEIQKKARESSASHAIPSSPQSHPSQASPGSSPSGASPTFRTGHFVAPRVPQHEEASPPPVSNPDEQTNVPSQQTKNNPNTPVVSVNEAFPSEDNPTTPLKHPGNEKKSPPSPPEHSGDIESNLPL